MVERGGLENRCTRERTVGSNPTPSAKFNTYLKDLRPPQPSELIANFPKTSRIANILQTIAGFP